MGQAQRGPAAHLPKASRLGPRPPSAASLRRGPVGLGRPAAADQPRRRRQKAGRSCRAVAAQGRTVCSRGVTVSPPSRLQTALFAMKINRIDGLQIGEAERGDPAQGLVLWRVGVVLRWRKRRWGCRRPDCSRESFTERIDELSARARTTGRLRRAVAGAVGAGRSVAEVAFTHRLSWPTVARAVVRTPSGCSVGVRPGGDAGAHSRGRRARTTFPRLAG
jgi:hypothetical protein